ncbi:hypothetical protein SAMN04488134_10734 [Amphibacillus marinus]|uniref:Uncharacterized protein n=1 Tax=Amphibacillus marinus TaxID=872970 RepID=A0A1H8PEB9_9BACI|nr:hypothetical protein [Amphibacillus marinus]SEO39873.1 hypothetical protein SAMN04488134_10734 [Amphibacillus marinus]
MIYLGDVVYDFAVLKVQGAHDYLSLSEVNETGLNINAIGYPFDLSETGAIIVDTITCIALRA